MFRNLCIIPLLLISGIAQAQLVSVCERSPSVRRALENKTEKHCSQITAVDLQSPYSLSVTVATPMKAHDLQGIDTDVSLYFEIDTEILADTLSGLEPGNDLDIHARDHIVVLRAGAAQNADYKRLSLDAYDGKIQIAAGAFDDAKVAEELRVDCNVVTTETGSLAGMHAAEVLWQACERALPAPGTFEGFSADQLQISTNYLAATLADGQFSGLSIGRHLHLNYAKIRQVETGAFRDAAIPLVFMQNNTLSASQQDELAAAFPSILFSF